MKRLRSAVVLVIALAAVVALPSLSSASQVRIPAGGSAAVALSVDPRLLASHPGLYEGDVVARDDATIIRTPVSVYLPPPTHTLTLRATALPGTGHGGMAASAFVLDVTDPDPFQASVTPIPASG